MDAHQAIAFNSEVSAAVLGNRAGEFLLVPLSDGGPLNAAVLDLALSRGYWYAGTMGYSDGKASSVCEPEAESIASMIGASVAFVGLVAGIRTGSDVGDSTSWLTRLHELPDTRA